MIRRLSHKQEAWLQSYRMSEDKGKKTRLDFRTRVLILFWNNERGADVRDASLTLI